MTTPAIQKRFLQPISPNNNHSPKAAAAQHYSSSAARSSARTNVQLPPIISQPTHHIIADAILDKVASNIQQARLDRNRSERGQIEYHERMEREEIIGAHLGYYDLIAGHLAHIEDQNQKKKPIHARAAAGFCLSRLEQRIADQARKDREVEMAAREEGRHEAILDKERAKQDANTREEMKRRLREDMVGFRAAGVFLIAEESRQRAMLDNEMGASLYAVRKRCTEEEALVMKAVADREAREEAARQSVISSAKKEAQAMDDKRKAEVDRRQQKLIGKCTHARNGGSVFTGPYPKKMCLICRIKLDPISGLYVVMERGDRK